MYDVKVEAVRVEIIENMKDKANADDSGWMLFAKFLANCFILQCRLLGIFFKGLWCFIKYAYYKLLALDAKD